MNIILPSIDGSDSIVLVVDADGNSVLTKEDLYASEERLCYGKVEDRQGKADL